MKKVFKKLLALTMLSVFLLVSAFAVNAEPVTEATEEDIAAMQAAGFPDYNFAKALVENGVTPTNYSTFEGTIDAADKNISDITGINKLVWAFRIDLTNNNISDLTPIMLFDDFYRGYIDVRFNPINNFPTNKHTTDYVFNFALSQSFSLETGRWFGTKLNVLNNGTDPTVKVDFDVTMDGEYWWNTEDAPKFNVDELFPYVVQSSSDDTSAWSYTFAGRTDPASGSGILTIKKTGYSQIRAPYEQFAYHCPWDGNAGSPQANSPEFRYTVAVDAYTKVVENVKANVLGGLKLVKIDSARNRLAGAQYGLFKDFECTESAGPVSETNANGEIVWSGLAPGTYYVKELKAPKGYKLDGTPHKVIVTNAGVDVSSGTFEGGYSSIEDVVSGNIELTPDWTSKERASVIPGTPSYQKEQDLQIVSGAVTPEVTAASEEVDAFIKNGGTTISAFKSEGFAAEGATVAASDLTLKLSSKDNGSPVASPAAARTTVNGLINGNELTSANDVIELTGTVTYQVSEEKFDLVTLEDTSLCVYFEPVADKKLVGLPIEGGMFGFVICDEGGEILFEGVNLEASADEDTTDVKFFDFDGHTAFFRFCSEAAGKTFTYTIKEVVKDEDRIEGVSYDEDERTMTVEVSETGTRGLAVKITVKNGDKVESENTLYSDQMNYENGEIVDFGTVNLCTIINRFIERENPKTGVPTLLSLVKLLTVAGASILLKKRFF